MRRIAYVVPRFPTITETFVLYEVLELRRLGVDVRVFSLILKREDTLQPGRRSSSARTRGARDLARKGREHVVEEFDLRRNARKLFQAFRELRDRPRAGTSPT